MFKFLIAGLVLALCAFSSSAQTWYLLRHFEKQPTHTNPGLVAQGQARAEGLAQMLAGSPITHIFSSDYRRTRASVAPLAERLGIEVVIYDPRDLPALTQRLAGIEQALVVGHSNTTPELVRLLEGRAEAMQEQDYGSLYVLTKTNQVTTTLRLTVPLAAALPAPLATRGRP